MPSTEKLRSNLDDVDDGIDSANIIADNETNVVRDEIDRKTHKRDILKQYLRRNRDDREVPAEVMEISKPMSNQTTENVIAAETTARPETTTEATTMAPQTTTVTETTGTTETSTAFLPPTFEFKPIYAFYYGGQPNEIANHIYITTSDPVQSTESTKTAATPSTTTASPKLVHNSIENRIDRNEFKPSIQYEHKNYRFDVDEHFVPIVGPQQIF